MGSSELPLNAPDDAAAGLGHIGGASEPVATH